MKNENMHNQDEKVKDIKPESKYKWTKDSKMIGTIILIVSVCLLIFAFVKVPFMSSINAYTIGMLMGYYSPLFYFFVIYKALVMIFGEKIKLPNWVKFTDVTYWVVAISIIFIASSMGFYQTKNGFTSFGTKTWGSFDNWYDSFTGNETESAWTPNNTNGGIIGVFLYSFTAMMFSGIGALIVSIIVLVIAVSILISGTTIGLYKDLIKRKKLDLKDKEIESEKKADINQFKTEEEKQEEKKENKKIESLPFDDPF